MKIEFLFKIPDKDVKALLWGFFFPKSLILENN